MILNSDLGTFSKAEVRMFELWDRSVQRTI